MTQSPRRPSNALASTDTPPPEMDGQFPGIAGGKTEAGQPGGASQATPRPVDLGSAEADREMLESLPLPLVLQVEQACGRFEDSWRTAGGGTAPRIEDHLAPAAGQQDQAPAEGSADPDRMRLALLRELVRIDIAYRSRAGQAPEAEEYLQRFPGLGRSWVAGVLAAELARGQRPAAAPTRPGTDTAAGRGSSDPAPAEPPRSLPAPFGDYELLEEIARGGMGVVYKARQVGLGRLVALKMILTGGRLPEGAVRRFHREAQAAAALDHPNIVAVHASGQHEGCPYYCMAYVEGDNLREVVRRDGLPAPHQAADWLRAVAEAVAFAHRQGIIHRDLKPENVLLDRQGRLRVTDFGLACQFEAAGPADRLTHTGQVLGTPAYMSPEQALGLREAVGPATDVYSLGGILYFLLTGQAPFLGRTPTEVLVHVTTRAPTPPREVNPQASAALESVCLRCLEKDPARRYPSAEALAAALRDPGPQADTQDDRGGSGGGPLPPSGQSAASPPTLTVAPGRSGAERGGWSRRTRVALAAVALAAIAAAVWFAVAPSRPAVEWRRPPEKLRVDFGLEFAMRDANAEDKVFEPGPDGVLQLRAGQFLRFRVKVEKDAYVGIWTINSDGSVHQLFPNEKEKDHFFPKGVPWVVPETEAVAVECEGETPYDWVWVQASTRPWDPDQGQRDGPFLLFKSDRELGQWGEQRGEIRLRSDPLAEAVLKFRVVPR
jgi:eukaryotic-like serine/threonine-protein kinase